VLQGLAAEQPQPAVEDPPEHGRVQQHEQRDDEHHRPAEVVLRDGGHEGQRRQHHEQAGRRREQQHDQGRRSRPAPRHAVVTGELRLHDHGPEAARDVLADLTHEEDPRGDRERQP
jgi:hypothetical protein